MGERTKKLEETVEFGERDEEKSRIVMKSILLVTAKRSENF